MSLTMQHQKIENYITARTWHLFVPCWMVCFFFAIFVNWTTVAVDILKHFPNLTVHDKNTCLRQVIVVVLSSITWFGNELHVIFSLSYLAWPSLCWTDFSTTYHKKVPLLFTLHMNYNWVHTHKEFFEKIPYNWDWLTLV